MTKKDKSKKKDKPEKESHPREPGDLQSEVTRASRSMRTFLTNSLSHSGIYAGQDGVILALAEEDGLSAGSIADRLGVKPPTMTRTLTRMQAQGFIQRQADSSDGRQMRAMLTDEGRKHGAAALAFEAGARQAGLGHANLARPTENRRCERRPNAGRCQKVKPIRHRLQLVLPDNETAPVSLARANEARFQTEAMAKGQGPRLFGDERIRPSLQ